MEMLLIIVILLCSIKISTTHMERLSNFLWRCNPSTCGGQEIRYPYNCGNRNYQLVCTGDKTFLGAPYQKYLVTNIDYHNYIINIVDTDLESGKCNLPFQEITSVSVPNGFSLVEGQEWFTFINCSEKTETYSKIAAIPCLSQNNRYIYVVPGYDISSLPKSCSYLTMVPISPHQYPITPSVVFYNNWGDVYNLNLSNIGDNIFGQLTGGFMMSWRMENTLGFSMSWSQRMKKDYLVTKRSNIIYDCFWKAVRYARWDLEDAPKKIEPFVYPFQFEFEFLFCIYETNDRVLVGCSTAFAVFLHIISFYLVIITVGKFIIAPLCIYVFLLYELLKMLSPVDCIEVFLRNQQRTSLTRYMYNDIVAMTRHFKDRLGEGGFGTVYKGELPGGYLVAIKLLGKSNDNGEDFISEVSTIGTIHHINIVRLVGFCSEGLHRALVYEYMHNGSLDKYIFSPTQRFTTKKLNEIALGVARGIEYLHRGCDMRILHFDIKPHNILLDCNFNPKVSDFGLAKLYSKDNSLVSTFAARGTIGYMAPELISRSFGLISYKSDVYSFGMLLLEMAGGRRNYDSRVENSSQAYYPSWIYDQLNQQSNLEVLDHEVEIVVDVEKKLCKIGLWCIQMSPSSRPTMNRVIEMLEDEDDNVEMPPKPFFFTSSQQTTREQNSFYMSFNEISTIYESE